MYSHVQTGTTIRIATLGAIVVFAGVFTPFVTNNTDLPPGIWLILLGSLGLAALLVMTMSRLRIELKDGLLSWSFGSGFPRFSLPISEVIDARIVRNPWYVGVGIHFLFSATVYNVAGSGAVEIARQSGRRIRLGTDEPDALLAAIMKARTGR